VSEDSSCAANLCKRTMKKKRKSGLTAEFWRRDAEGKRQLAERIAYHEERRKKEREAREASQ